VTLSLFQPGSLSVEVEVHLHRDMGQPCVRESELRIALNGFRQVLGGALEILPENPRNSREDRL
jgi:hypothetical protein